MKDFSQNFFDLISACMNSVSLNDLERASHIIQNCNSHGGKLIFCGNGGSAAIASHCSVDFTKAASIRAINFNESDLLTCFANDYGYENVFSAAVDFYADKNDVLILISSSGESPNIINAAKKAKDLTLPLITLSGFQENNALRQLGDINLWADSSGYNIVECVHQIWLLNICDFMIGSHYYSAN
jgi:D-sedoheptulose 7-phosphate isomerase